MIKVDLRQDRDGRYRIVLPFHVTPKASRNELLPYQANDDCLKIKVTAPPEDGKANDAVIALLSDELRVAKSMIEVVSGAQSRHKRIAIRLADHSPDDLIRALSRHLQTEEEAWFGIVNP